jgi:hypothetical protein
MVFTELSAADRRESPLFEQYCQKMLFAGIMQTWSATRSYCSEDGNEAMAGFVSARLTY